MTRLWTILRQTKIIFRRREKVKQPSCSLLTRGKRKSASKTLPETSTQGLSNDLFWDPCLSSAGHSQVVPTPEELRSRAPPSFPAEELMTEMFPLKWTKCCFTAIAPDTKRQKSPQPKAAKILGPTWPPSNLFCNTTAILKLNVANPQINLLGPSFINSWRQATIFEPKHPPFPSLVLQLRMISVPMTMRLPRTFMAPPSTSAASESKALICMRSTSNQSSGISSLGCSGCAMLWQFSKCSSAEAPTNASLLKAKQGPCKAFMALTDSFPCRLAVSTKFNVAVTKRVVPWSRSVGSEPDPRRRPQEKNHHLKPELSKGCFPPLESLARTELLHMTLWVAHTLHTRNHLGKLKGAGHKAQESTTTQPSLSRFWGSCHLHWRCKSLGCQRAVLPVPRPRVRK